FLQLGVDVRRPPSQPERQVKRMHSEVSHHADLAARPAEPLPVSRFVRVEIAGMMKPAAYFENPAEGVPACRFIYCLRAGKKRKCRTASYKPPAAIGVGGNPLRGVQIDAERLLGKQVLSGLQHIGIDIRMQM